MSTVTPATELHEIEDVLDQIRPAVRADGGDIELVSFDPDQGLVSVRLVGACHDCPMSLATLRAGIEQRLCMALADVKSVEAVE
ncbi:MAG: NifU family protein [Gemmatimonadetes bacterium]|nr:NifU family protein [Gemmatimonadota bacterium]